LRRDVQRHGGKGYEAWKVDEERPEGILGRFALEPSRLLEAPRPGGVDRGVRAIAVGVDGATEANSDSRGIDGFVIAAGSDRKVRFWNLTKVESSVVICGLEADEPKPIFSTSHPTPTLTLNTEKPNQIGSPSLGYANSQSSSVSSKRGKGGGRQSRSSVISLQQQTLLKNHIDVVLDVAVLEWPYGMVISVDRQGVIKVFS